MRGAGKRPRLGMRGEGGQGVRGGPAERGGGALGTQRAGLGGGLCRGHGLQTRVRVYVHTATWNLDDFALNYGFLALLTFLDTNSYSFTAFSSTVQVA